jgi:hypothetical protein
LFLQAGDLCEQLLRDLFEDVAALPGLLEDVDLVGQFPNSAVVERVAPPLQLQLQVLYLFQQLRVYLLQLLVLFVVLCGVLWGLSGEGRAQGLQLLL